MDDPIAEFEKACEAAGVGVLVALERGRVGRSTWFRWKAKNGGLPSFRSIRKAYDGLERAKLERTKENRPQPAAA